MTKIDDSKLAQIQQAEVRRCKKWLDSVGRNQYQQIIYDAKDLEGASQQLEITTTQLRYWIRNSSELAYLTKQAVQKAKKDALERKVSMIVQGALTQVMKQKQSKTEITVNQEDNLKKLDSKLSSSDYNWVQDKKRQELIFDLVEQETGGPEIAEKLGITYSRWQFLLENSFTLRDLVKQASITGELRRNMYRGFDHEDKE